MKLPVAIVRRWEDVQRNFEAIQSRLIDLASTLTLPIGIRFGKANVPWPGASSVSTQLLFNHNLGRTPIICLATHNDQSGTGFCLVEGSFNATQVGLRLSTLGFAPAVGTTSPVSWLVIG